MTNANTATQTTVTEKAVDTATVMASYNVTVDMQKNMVKFLNGQSKTGLVACKNWLSIGSVLARIDANTNRSTRNGVIAEIFKSHKWGKDEINYAIKMDGVKTELLEWYQANDCTRHNPRTIYTAFTEGSKSEEDKAQEKADREKAQADKLEQEEAGAKKYLDVAQSISQSMKYYEKATLDGNLTPDEMLKIATELEMFTNRVKEDCALAMKAEKVEAVREEKKVA